MHRWYVADEIDDNDDNDNDNGNDNTGKYDDYDADEYDNDEEEEDDDDDEELPPVPRAPVLGEVVALSSRRPRFRQTTVGALLAA